MRLRFDAAARRWNYPLAADFRRPPVASSRLFLPHANFAA